MSGTVSAAEQEGDVGHHGPGHSADVAHTPGRVLVMGGSHQAVEQCPQGAGVSPLLRTAPRAASTGPSVRGRAPGLEEVTELLHLGLVNILRQALVTIRPQPLKQ